MNPIKINKKKWIELVGEELGKREIIEHIGLKRDKFTGEYLNWF